MTSSNVDGGCVAASKPKRLGSSGLRPCILGRPIPLPSKDGLLQVWNVMVAFALLQHIYIPVLGLLVEVLSVPSKVK